MTVTLTQRAPIERTEHPHVVKSADTLGGEPRVVDTRMPVRQLHDMAECGMSADEIVADFPYLTHAWVHDALSYAYDHPKEMAFHREWYKLRKILREQDLVFYNHELRTRDRLAARGPLPTDAKVYTWEALPPEYDEG